jgi:hypothetical protein
MSTVQLKDIVVPTILIEGADAPEHATQLLCRHFCRQEAGDCDCFCLDCRRIKQHQHPALIWICPEKDYTVAEVEVIFDKVRFTLEDNERFFFVLEKAQTLNPATANRLLKILEEPPRGYVFLLLTANKNAILPTILSRSYIISLGGWQKVSTLHPVMEYLVYPAKLDDPIGFEQELKRHKLSEHEAVQLCFELLEYLVQQQACPTADTSWIQASIEMVKDHLRTPPATASADFFLKRLFLNMPRS